jgi:hypothetical protein
MVMDEVAGLRGELELSASRYTLLQQEKQEEVSNIVWKGKGKGPVELEERGRIWGKGERGGR